MDKRPWRAVEGIVKSKEAKIVLNSSTKNNKIYLGNILDSGVYFDQL
jgi:hypothetical protein